MIVNCVECAHRGRWKPHWPAVVHDHGECRRPPQAQTPHVKPLGWADEHYFRRLR